MTTKSTIQSLLFLLLALSMAQPLIAQDRSRKDKPTLGSNTTNYQPREIQDAFAPDAVTYDEMVERAKYHPYMPQEIVVAMQVEVPKAGAAALMHSFDYSKLFGQPNVKFMAALTTVERTPGRSVILVHLSLPVGMDVFTAMKMLEGKSGVLWSSPNFYYDGDPRDITPNDPQYAMQYHHPLMSNDLAWDITLGSAAIKIGIADDGVELAHTDLAANIWVNPGEIAGNGIDDDGNGYIDDVNGWDFSNNNNNPNQNINSDNHGTHVAGIAAGRTDNSIGIAGTAGHCTIVPLQFYGNGNPWTAAIINATYTYAADNGVKVINVSYNIDGFVGDAVFLAGLQYLYDAGVLYLNSAGNSDQLNPPRQVLGQALFVASTDASDIKSSFSNHGTGIDVSAPGSSIRSTLTVNSYGLNSGTSMAAPNAAGVAALIWSANPSWTRDQVAAQLLATADNIDALNPDYIGLLGTGRVNSYAALTTTLPAPKVKSVVGLPANGGVAVIAGINSFSVAFNQVMAPASVNDLTNFELRYAGPNGTFDNGDDIVYPLTTTGAYQIGTNQKTYQITNLPLNCGLYRLTLNSGGLENPFGTDLDGDGNGSAGDDYVQIFSLVDDLYYLDSDNDGYGAGAPASVCPPPMGYILLNGDCDDSNGAINPLASEVCDGADNDCDGITDFSTAATFTNSNVPVTIPSSGTPTVTSTMVVSGAVGNITDLNVKDLLIHHTWIGDLKVTLTSPGGDSTVLFNRPSNGNCGDNHILATFDDAAVLTAADFETTCNSSINPTPPPYAINGTYQPLNPLSVFNGTNANGIWTLTVQDFINEDGGSIQGWGLEISTPGPLTSYYADTDGDTYGDPANSLGLSCIPAPSLGYVLDNTDCDDTDDTVHPGAAETCDGCDKDCDGFTGDGAPTVPCGQPSPANCLGVSTCEVQPVPFPGACLTNGSYGPCNNNPQPETCDGIDNNCNGMIDDGIPPVPCVPAGTPGGLVYGGTSQCQMGTMACGGTCVGFVGPSAEVCDGIDNDCDGTVDEASTCCPSGILYVNDDASGLNNGSSWANAFTSLQSALAATCPGVTQIWVAAGTYKPTTGTDRNISFVMKNGVAIYGGFVGNEPSNYDLGLRNIAANTSTLSGDLLGNDGANFANNSDNSTHVISNTGLNNTALLDGFTITAANGISVQNGGGMINNNASPTVTNCIFSDNTMSSAGNGGGGGGGMTNHNFSSPIVSNCTFSGNLVTGAYGGGMFNLESSPTVNNCSFTENTTTGGGGAGMYNQSSSATVTNCAFSGNSGAFGGGMGIFGVNAAVTNCIFLGNSAVTHGGGGIFIQNASPVINNCTFSGNTDTANGGAVRLWGSSNSPVFNNCILWGNSSPEVFTDAGSTSAFNNSIVQGGCPAAATCTSVLNQNPLFVNQPPIVLGTTGNLHLTACSPALDAGNDADNLTTTDLDGNDRKFEAIPGGQMIDMGAYEYQATPNLCLCTDLRTWTGAISTDWNTNGNWNPGCVPTADNDVTIPDVANDPVIMGGTAALSNSVVVHAGAVLTVDGTSSLTINGSFNVYGILNALYSEGTVQNNGQIIIGSLPNIGNNGIWNLGIFNNNGTISIDNVNSLGLYLYGGTFTNAGDIFIGNTALPAQDCIQNNGGTMINTSTGEITVDRAVFNGIWNVSGSFQNSGKITVGSIANTGTGILNTASFTSNAGAEIHIDRVPNGIISTNAFTNAGLIRMGENAPLTGSGIANVQGANAVFNNNAGGDISIKQTSVDGVLNEPNSTFNNNACATLSIFDNLNNSGIFTNAGLFTVTTAQAHTNTALTNDGIIAYPLGNPIPNVTNNEIIIDPVTANDCEEISPAFSLGSPVDFTIEGIFTDAAATMSAGTYVTATNTFMPTSPLAEATHTFYVKIQDGTGGCTRTVPWSLTTEDCCDAPEAICQNFPAQLTGTTVTILPANIDNGSTYDCGLQTMSVSPNTFSCGDLGPQSVTLTVTDLKGASDQCTATITVQDVTPPVPVCKTTTVQLNATGSYTLTQNDVYGGGTDNCTNVNFWKMTPTAVTCAQAGTTVAVLVQVLDGSGNQASCNANVSVEDNIAPTAFCKNIAVQLGANGMATIAENAVNNGSTDACGGLVFDTDITTFSCSNVPSANVTLTVTDGSGNPATCTATVTVSDNLPPTVLCKATTIHLDAAGESNLATSQVDNGSSDNCGIASLSVSPNSFSCANVGPNTVTLTVTDVNNLVSTCTATVTVVDNLAPIATCTTSAINATLNANGQYTVNPTDLDGGSTDACGILSLSASPSLLDCGNEGPNTVTLTVADVNGNMATCAATVTVAPFITGVTISSTPEECAGTGGGSITLSASSPGGLLGYSINGGISFQFLGHFPNLVAGTYNVVIKVFGIPSLCTETTVVTVAQGPAPTVWYQDFDGDGYTGGATITSCLQPSGYISSPLGIDCNDNNPAVFTGASEICDGLDNDCDGQMESATNTWTGLGDGLLWSDGANWSEGFFPLSCQHVVVPAGSTVRVSAGFHGRGKTLDVSLQADLEVLPTGVLEIKN